MKKFAVCFMVWLVAIAEGFSQTPNLINANPLSPTSEMASRNGEEPLNTFTGVPEIGVPLYSYSSSANGLSLDIFLGYFAGGVQVSEAPTTAGMGWYLNAGGIITRIVRGKADDAPLGFMHIDTIPNDFRSKADNYYNDSVDAEQDIFQYNFNGRSGAFYIGKNGQVAQVPLTKMKITPLMSGNSIIGFNFVTESGVTYLFNQYETTNPSGYVGYSIDDYYSSWSLGKIISAFNTDTIYLNYTSKSMTNSFFFPPITYIRNSDGNHTNKIIEDIDGNNISYINKISSIVFPDKTTVSFLYGPDIYSNGDNALFLVKIQDTTFRYGYIFNYQSVDSTGKPSRLLLKTVTPYTALQKGLGYSFNYYSPTLAPLLSAGDTIRNDRDYWGLFNGAFSNHTLVPNVNGYTWGADRNPNLTYAVAGSLKNFCLPKGGYISYEYELNDHYPYTKVPNTIYFDASTSSSFTAIFSQVFNTGHEMVLTMDSSISRQGAPPFSGAGIITLNIKNTAGTITYISFTFSLYDLFYKGMLVWDFNLPNGTYKLEQLAGSFTFVPEWAIKASWENKIADGSKLATLSGGLRIKRISHYTAVNEPAASIEEFKYINTDNTSSGFLGDFAQYYYPYRETVNYGGLVTTNYTVVPGDPWLNNMDGGIAAYSRVEVIRGTATHNTGKSVYEYTSPQDLNAIYPTAVFPYTPLDLKSWGFGQLKKVSVYDSSGRIVKKITNTYRFDTTLNFKNKNFRSLKLGISYAYINGDPVNPATPKTYTYTGREYFPPSGRLYLASATDTLFQSDGSKNTSYANYVYDTNYNVTKIIVPYDKNRALLLEKRLYYPYNYTISDGAGLLRSNGIISPVVATENWITGDGHPRIISGSINYYHQISGNYVKPLTVYALQSNHPVDSSVIGPFNPASLNRNSNYFVAQANLSYDNKGNLQQEQNAISGISNSVIMDYWQRYPIAKVSNATVVNIAYTSFEADGNGNWTIGSPVRDTTSAITGNRSYNLSNGSVSKSGLTSSVSYLVTLWAKSGASVQVNGATQSNILATQNGWNFYSASVSGVTTITVSGSGLVDELRLYPKDANMVTYTYQPGAGITSATDANNTIVYNEYDGLNRLKIVRDKDKNILKRYDYSDTVTSINIQPVWTFKNIQCGNGDGEKDSVFVDTNIYSSTYNTQKYMEYTTTEYCTCGYGSHPEYKIVNGSCQQAMKCTTSSYYVKIRNPDDTYSWKWKCTWHYKWSDGSVTPDYIEYDDNSSAIGCTYTHVIEE